MTSTVIGIDGSDISKQLFAALSTSSFMQSFYPLQTTR